MKKTLFGFIVIGIAVLALGLTNVAYAHSPNPTVPDDSYPYGPGMVGGYGMMGGFGYDMMDWYGEEGPMHDAMINAVAEVLGLSPEELEARHDAGETLWEIAEAEGLSKDETQELMFSVHDQALEDAVAEGLLTQEQADWMDEHMDFMWDSEYNHCDGEGAFGPTSGWQGMNW